MTDSSGNRATSTTSHPKEFKLLAIVAVDQSDRVKCGHSGCVRSVYSRIHVVREGSDLLVLGSTCFAKRYGAVDALGSAQYGGGSGRQLTSEERQLLVENTAALLARFEDEERERLAIETLKVPVKVLPAPPAFAPISPRRPTFAHAPSNLTPWEWMKPMTSMAYFQFRDGTGWVRVQRKDGKQLLVPWPSFDGWDEALPGHIGAVDLACGGYLLNDVIAAVRYLRELSAWDRVTGVWREIAALANK